MIKFFNKKINVRVKFLSNDAILPSKAHYNDAGFDLFATSKKETNKFIEYGTGIAIEIPDNYVGLIFPRSSVTKQDLMLKNSVGVIDSGYRGEIKFRFVKAVNDIFKKNFVTDGERMGSMKEIIDVGIPERKIDTYNIGEKIGQIIFLKLPNIKLTLVNELNNSKRGEGGYGSTGN